MVIVLEHNVAEKKKQAVKDYLSAKGYRIKEIVGEEETILGAVGLSNVDLREVELQPGVARVIPITKPYKFTSREFRKDDTIIAAGPLKIGGNRISVIAGPCAVESRAQILETAHLVKESGAVILRGGAFKPRTSPYAFQGLGEKGLRYLKEASEKTGMPVCTEIVSPEHLHIMKPYVDIFQIGARNMQNFELLKNVGALGRPVILKRGLAATIQELLMSAEYLIAHGTDSVILCERGIRTFETYTRNTLDLSAIPVVKKLSHLPIVVDPSHGTGIRENVIPMALAAVAAGADGIMVEVHPNPDKALSDGPQSLYPQQFEKLMRDIEILAPVIEKEFNRLPEKKARPASPKARPRKKPSSGVVRVAFQGERGAFSEKAVFRYFQDAKSVPCEEFRGVFNAVLKGEAPYGIVPLENSLMGSIHQNYDLLLQYPDIRIVGEKKIRIVHNLIGLPDAELKDIRRVYTHPAAFEQCVQFLGQYPDWQKIPLADTAGSVAYIAKQGKKSNAAIASAEAAGRLKMKVLKEGIETNVQNYTKFVVIAREESAQGENPDKASFVFSTPDKPGALFSILRILAEKKINMQKLESRPIHGKPWEYMFYIDVIVSQKHKHFLGILDSLKKETENFRILGIYKV
jgi:3-deoxy-7-phosphoheptulonate synthase